jgi:hypothetical protein
VDEARFGDKGCVLINQIWVSEKFQNCNGMIPFRKDILRDGDEKRSSL